jgi:hypothetical protein
MQDRRLSVEEKVKQTKKPPLLSRSPHSIELELVTCINVWGSEEIYVFDIKEDEICEIVL